MTPKESRFSRKALLAQTDEFITFDLCEALRAITVGGNPVRVEADQKRTQIFGRIICIHSPEWTQTVWVGLNVNRLFVIYPLLARDKPEEYVNEIEHIFRFTFSGASKLGYSTHFQRAHSEGQDIVSVWAVVTAPQELLDNPKLRLFWSQDIAMMTASFLMTALRNPSIVTMSGDFPAGPL